VSLNGSNKQSCLLHQEDEEAKMSWQARLEVAGMQAVKEGNKGELADVC